MVSRADALGFKGWVRIRVKNTAHPSKVVNARVLALAGQSK